MSEDGNLYLRRQGFEGGISCEAVNLGMEESNVTGPGCLLTLVHGGCKPPRFLLDFLPNSSLGFDERMFE